MRVLAWKLSMTSTRPLGCLNQLHEELCPSDYMLARAGGDGTWGALLQGHAFPMNLPMPPVDHTRSTSVQLQPMVDIMGNKLYTWGASLLRSVLVTGLVGNRISQASQEMVIPGFFFEFFEFLRKLSINGETNFFCTFKFRFQIHSVNGQDFPVTAVIGNSDPLAIFLYTGTQNLAPQTLGASSLVKTILAAIPVFAMMSLDLPAKKFVGMNKVYHGFP